MLAEIRHAAIRIEESIRLGDQHIRHISITLNHRISVHLRHNNVQKVGNGLGITVQAEVVHPDFEFDTVLGAMVLGNVFVVLDRAQHVSGQRRCRVCPAFLEPVAGYPADLAASCVTFIEKIVLPLKI